MSSSHWACAGPSYWVLPISIGERDAFEGVHGIQVGVSTRANFDGFAQGFLRPGEPKKASIKAQWRCVPIQPGPVTFVVQLSQSQTTLDS